MSLRSRELGQSQFKKFERNRGWRDVPTPSQRRDGDHDPVRDQTGQSSKGYSPCSLSSQSVAILLQTTHRPQLVVDRVETIAQVLRPGEEGRDEDLNRSERMWEVFG